ncbi:MAG: DNA polymerase III subunit alpha [Planctomycetes bacterium]|nr:DNA polymerase III subunit alpha [Planctomycetota bacterium]
MSAPDFVHLHVHSEYSLLDGANRIGDLVDACTRDGQRALALTDHGNLFGSIELYQTARKSGVKPILGCEVYVARRSRFEPHSKAKGNGYHHLTLLARDAEGWRNLVHLASLAYLEGHHFRPRVDREVLAKHARGLTCLSGCLAGEMSQLVIAEREAEALELAATWRDLFGPEHFWLELQRNGLETQDKVNEALVRIHQRTGIPLVGTNDIHYLREEDCQAQDVLLCINTGAKRSDEKRFRFETDTLFFKTRAQMADVFRDLPQCVKGTMDVAEQVNLDIEFGKYRLPVFTPDTAETADQVFDRLLEAGLGRLYPAGHEAARARLDYEKRVIRELGFVSYFLVVWDLVRWSRENGVPVGPGRGSAAGSIVAYLLGITKVDPLRYDLLFERFLNSSRVSMPDIDIDFCMEGREKVLAYTRRRYGDDHVAQIVTFGTMASRTVVRDVGRALDLPLAEVDRVAKKIPAGPNAPSLKEFIEKDADIQAVIREKPQLAELFQISVPLEGLARHISTHAAGVVIADRPIVEYVPLAKNGDDVCTQWPAPQLEDLGLLKMDYLGLRTLTILEKALANIRKQGGTPPDLDALPPGDPRTYRLLTAGDTLGVFQLESEGMKKLLGRIKPDCFEDLIAILALYRPGPLESGMVEMFTRRKHGEEAIQYPHPSLETILRDTYGCIVYQEQVMLISSALSGFSLNEADNLRKAMGKKKPEIMQKFSEQFVAGAVANGCAESVAREIWDNILKFGGYGFNKSHSTAYAVLTYQTAFLKANHRSAFLAANLSCEMSNTKKVKEFVDDARKSGVELRPPSIERSVWEFEPEGEALRYGFGAIKGTGEKAIHALVEARSGLHGRRTAPTLHALCAEVDPQATGKLCWEALIKAGAFDALDQDRGALLASVESAMAEGARAAADRRSGQGSLFGAAPAVAGGAARAAATGPRAGTLSKAEVLRGEFEVLGFYLSGHPLEERAGLLSLLSSVNVEGLTAIPGGTELTVAGMILGKSEVVVKSGALAGRKMCRFRLEDLSGNVGVTCFPRTYEEQKHKLEDGRVVVLKVKLEEGAEEPALLLEELWTVEEALGRFQGGVVVNVAPEDEHLLPELRRVVDGHKGRAPLYLQVQGLDGRTRRVRAGGDCRVAISERFAQDVDALLGQGRVRLARV